MIDFSVRDLVTKRDYYIDSAFRKFAEDFENWMNENEAKIAGAISQAIFNNMKECSVRMDFSIHGYFREQGGPPSDMTRLQAVLVPIVGRHFSNPNHGFRFTITKKPLYTSNDYYLNIDWEE